MKDPIINQVTGIIPDEYFDNDPVPRDDDEVLSHYSPEFIARFLEIGAVKEHYNPSQPRDPKGSATGGQWKGKGAAPRTVTEMPRRGGGPSDALYPDNDYGEGGWVGDKGRVDANAVVADIEQFEDPISSEFNSRITMSEREAILSYTGTEYDKINKSLRTGKKLDKQNELTVKEMDSALAKAVPLKEDIIVYRYFGDKSGDRIFTADNVGKSWVEPGFSSTGIAPRFGEPTNGTISIARIKIPKGSKVAFVEDLSISKGEHEVILPRGAKFKVIDKFSKPSKSPFVSEGSSKSDVMAQIVDIDFVGVEQ